MLWDVALRNMWQRRLRSTLTVLGVAVAVQLYLTMSSIMSGYEQDLQQQLSALAGKVFVQRPVMAEGGVEDFPSPSSSIEAEIASALLTLEDIDRTSSSAVLFVPLGRPAAPNMPPEVIAVGIEPGHEAAFLGSFEVEAGQVTLTDANGVVLGQRAAERYQPEGSEMPVEPGQTIEVLGQSFTVIGVLEPATFLFDGMVMMPLSTAQDLFARSDTVSAIILTAASVDEVAALAQTVETKFPELEASGQDNVAENASEVLSAQRAFFSMINNTVIAVAVVVITIVMIVAVMERRREIGTLRAIGARRWAIFSLVVSESLILSLIGALVALPMWAIFSQIFLGNLTITDDFLGTVEVIISGFVRISLMALVVGILASLWPAWQAMRVDPLEALRYE